MRRLTIGRELAIISASVTWDNSGVRRMPRESLTPNLEASSAKTKSSRSRNDIPRKRAQKQLVPDQEELSISSNETSLDGESFCTALMTWSRVNSATDTL